MAHYVIWALQEERLRIGVSLADCSPIPFAAQVITIVDSCDLPMVREWCHRMARQGWSVKKMRMECEGEGSYEAGAASEEIRK